ncbi:TetR/AcrR family transcriptional regulator [Agromyces atrinae]|nr:TetR/AcrR family transcriptional regulator [Agromyces atrinae]NYD66208.1 AcrR family transcriptional regulator [Agromyces atrinae]
MTTTRAARGRPRAVSRAMLEDAATELFLEQGYAKTSVEQIAQRAGVSRNTFFNYFSGKADVFWVGIDGADRTLRRTLAEIDDSWAPLEGVTRAVLAVAADFGPSSVPWVLTHATIIGSIDDLRSTAADRVAAVSELIGLHLAGRTGLPTHDIRVRGAANAVTAAIVTALGAWSAAGVSRGALEPFVATALAPAVRGFDEELAHAASVQ